MLMQLGPQPGPPQQNPQAQQQNQNQRQQSPFLPRAPDMQRTPASPRMLNSPRMVGARAHEDDKGEGMGGPGGRRGESSPRLLPIFPQPAHYQSMQPLQPLQPTMYPVGPNTGWL
jgi:hypothetical protein